MVKEGNFIDFMADLDTRNMSTELQVISEMAIMIKEIAEFVGFDIKQKVLDAKVVVNK